MIKLSDVLFTKEPAEPILPAYLHRAADTERRERRLGLIWPVALVWCALGVIAYGIWQASVQADQDAKKVFIEAVR